MGINGHHKRNNICIMGIQEKGTASIFKAKVAAYLTSLRKKQKSRIKMPQRPQIGWIWHTSSSNCEQQPWNNFESIERLHKRSPLKTIDFSTEMFQARREWGDAVKIFERKNPRILYLVNPSFRKGGERETFLNKQKVRNHHH